MVLQTSISSFVWNYASKSEYADIAIEQANQAFYWLTGYKIE